jgi:hypothetical protein
MSITIDRTDPKVKKRKKQLKAFAYANLPRAYARLYVKNLNTAAVVMDAFFASEERTFVIDTIHFDYTPEGYDFWDRVDDYVRGRDVELPPLPVKQ